MRRVPSFSSRPGFPEGLRVLVVDAESSVRQKLEELSYDVTCCGTGREACTLLGAREYDIVLVEAKALSKEALDGGSLREAASHLPLVLMSERGSSTDDVWRGIELGAADVLEKPLSQLKLRNIWQHVVRKMMSSGSGTEGLAKEPPMCCKTEPGVKPRAAVRGVSAPSSPRTPSPAASMLTLGSESATEKSCKGGDEASFSGGGAGDLKHARSLEMPEICEMRASAESSGAKAGEASLHAVKTSCSSRKSKRAKGPDTPASVASRPPLAIRPPAWAAQPQPHMGGAVMGVAPPHCYMQAVDPLNGCVWGTPAMGAVSQAPASSAFSQGWGGYSAPGAGAGAAPLPPACSTLPTASTSSLHTCPSGGASSLGSLDSSLTLCSFGGDYLGNDDVSLDDVLLPDEDLLDLAPDEPTMKAPELPPIGLKLKKSASLVDLINAQLQSNHGAGHGGLTDPKPPSAPSCLLGGAGPGSVTEQQRESVHSL